MVSHYYRCVDAVVLVYDVTSIQSFDSLKRWIEECKTHDILNTPKILVGNKCDMEAKVPRYDAQVFADQHNMPVKYIYLCIVCICVLTFSCLF